MSENHKNRYKTTVILLIDINIHNKNNIPVLSVLSSLPINVVALNASKSLRNFT
jgi:hypothetical protein